MSIKYKFSFLAFVTLFSLSSVLHSQVPEPTKKGTSEVFSIAARDAMVYELPIAIGLLGLGAVGVIPPLTMAFVAATTAMHFVGMSVRVTCREYFNEGQKWWMCGAIGGALKYGGRAALLAWLDPVTYPTLMAKWLATLVRGSINAGLYEADESSVNIEWLDGHLEAKFDGSGVIDQMASESLGMVVGGALELISWFENLVVNPKALADSIAGNQNDEL